MLHTIYNKDSGQILRANAQSVGMYISNYKSMSAAKAALTRLLKKNARRLEVKAIYDALNTPDSNFHDVMTALSDAGCTKREAYNASSKVDVLNREDYVVATVEDYRVAFPVKMVEKVNLMSGKTYMEADNTPSSCSPASELYWSM